MKLALVPSNPSAAGPPVAKSRAAYERRLAEILAVPDAEVVPVNLDAISAVCTVLGSLEQIRALREAMNGIAFLDFGAIDALEDLVWAFDEARNRHFIARAPLPPGLARPIAETYEEAVRLRETFRVALLPLTHAGVVDVSRLRSFTGTRGFVNVSTELSAYALLFLDEWPRIEGKTPLARTDVLDAAAVALELRKAAGICAQAPRQVAEASLIRNRAFTLLLRAWSEVQRAVSCVRWHEGDAHLIAPSLYRTHRGG